MPRVGDAARRTAVRSLPRQRRLARAAAPMDEPVARAKPTAPVRAIKSFEDLIALAAEKRDLAIKSALERDVRLVRFEDGTLELALEPSARKTLVGELVQETR